MVDKFRAGILGLLAPERCHWCGAPVTGHPVCGPCQSSLPWNHGACRTCAAPVVSGVASTVCAGCLSDAPPQHRSWAAFRYAAPVAQQIVDLKFHGQLAPARVLGALMAGRLAARAEPMPELLVPVPLHRERLRRRGYNQALEMARELARRLSIPLAPGAAQRLWPTREQTRLAAADRRRNVRGVFAIGDEVRGRHIALLDDVITTGATAAELARAARAAGAARIEVWAAARAV